jgi:multidrug transporter EmrE-like cation transporter
LHGRSIVWIEDFQIAVIGLETAISATGISLAIPIFASLARDAAVVVGVSFVAKERAEMDVIGCALICPWMRKHERASVLSAMP